MAKQLDQRTFNISVIGLSGTEKEKGVLGIGKSCLCNRFIHSIADKYHRNHISVLSQTDFSGRVVNNDHFLYWGDVTKTVDDGVDFRFHVIEQTEFVDDSSFQPFKSKRTETYIRRATTTKISSAEKLMYICKDQLGLEHEFAQKLLPAGKLNIDGFLCLFDVSKVAQRPVKHMVDYTVHLLNQVMKTKRPVVLVTSKNEEANEAYVHEAERIVGRKEFKGNIPIVESSAHENVNVELAFLTLAHLIDKTKGRTKIVPYSEAKIAQRKLWEVVKDAYLSLLCSQIPEYKTNVSSKRLNHFPEYKLYVDMFGTDNAKKLFKRHVRQLKDECINKKQQIHLNSFRRILHEILPDLSSISDSWTSCLKRLDRREDFETYFVRSAGGFPWFETDLLESLDPRIPFDLLNSDEAEDIFNHYAKALRDEHRRTESKKQFKQLLSESSQVTPGSQLSEVEILFLGRECFSSLSEADRQNVFDEHQREIGDRARQNFMELLLENPALFLKADPHCTHILNDISATLKYDCRYQTLDKLEDDRKVLILKHLVFHQNPFKEQCPFEGDCAEVSIQQLLSTKAHRPQSWNRHSQWILDSEDSQLNLVLLGTNSLGNDLVSEIRTLCVDDSYQQDGLLYNLDYRLIDGDVALPQNSFKTADFLPHGCFCVYSSLQSLAFIRQSLTQTLLADLEHNSPLPFQGLPIVLILAYDSMHSGKALEELHNEGQVLADSLQCPFIGLPATFALENDRKFPCSQVHQALQALITSIKHRAGFVFQTPIAASMEPDVRILMCMMCGDDYRIDVPLDPLLHHQCCYVTSDKFPTVTLETCLGDSKRKVEVCVTSYHGGYDLRENLFHGYVLVYCAERRASLEALRTMASLIPPNIPTMILAVAESGGADAIFSIDFSQNFITEGSMIADDIGAYSFTIVNSHFQNQSASYTSFFNETWEKKHNTEFVFSSFFEDEPLETEDAQFNHYTADNIAVCPPAHLPKIPKHHDITRGSTESSNSSEDSEPVYDHPQAHHSYSDSEFELVFPVMPPFGNSSPQNTVHLRDDGVSQIKHANCKLGQDQNGHSRGQQNMYTAWGRGQSNWTKFDHLGSTPAASKTLSITQSQTTTKTPKFFDESEAIWQKRTVEKTRPDAKVNLVRVPLPTTENIEFGDYAQVRDAVEIVENDYASVQDALPAGKLHRIHSNIRKQREPKEGADSDPEGISSLDQDRGQATNGNRNRVQRKPTPYKKKHHSGRLRVPDSHVPPQLPVSSYEDKELLIPADQMDRVRTNLPSEGSDGTGDELQRTTKNKKRRAFIPKKKKQQDEEELLATSLPDESCMFDYMSRSLDGDDFNFAGSREDPEVYRYRDDMDEFGDGSHRKHFRHKRSEVDQEKLRRKEEKRSKVDERRRAKEEEKKLKEQQKSHRKQKERKLPDSQAIHTLEESSQTGDCPIPYFVEKCIVFIEQEGLSVEGLYRVSGNKAQVDHLLESFKEDPEADWHQLSIAINTVTTALKGFFSDLTEPLVPKPLLDELLVAAVIPSKSGRLLAIRGIVKKLPPASHEVLKYLMVHLYKLTRFSDVSRMDSKNLAICWWPTILRPEFTSIETVTQASKQLEQIIALLIEENGFFFYGDPCIEL